MTSPFDPVADAYAGGRPGYPDGLYAALERLAARPLRGSDVVDVGAGTGIATRQLAARGARVVGVELGARMAGRLRADSPGVPVVRGDGNALPLRDGAADLVTYAQAWHWTEPDRSVPEAFRVLRPGGALGCWWSHARADGEPWFDAYLAAMEAACLSFDRRARDIDFGAAMAAAWAGDNAAAHVRVPWTRTVPVEGWLADERSKSYVAALDEAARGRLLARTEGLLRDRFADGVVRVAYETWLWVLRR